MSVPDRRLDTRGERVITTGAYALRVDEYVREYPPIVAERPESLSEGDYNALPTRWRQAIARRTVPVPDLTVISSNNTTALYHDATSLYGFLHLPAGSHQLLVLDPRGQFLPLLHTIDVPDRSGYALGLRKDPPWNPESSGVRDRIFGSRLVRPARTRIIPPGQTVVTGSVIDAAGRPVAWAFVRLDYPSSSSLDTSFDGQLAGLLASYTGLTWTGLTDAHGSFLLWLRDVLPGADKTPLEGASIAVYARANPSTSSDIMIAMRESLCPTFDDVAANRTERDQYTGPTGSWQDAVGGARILFGQRTQLPPITVT